MVDLNNFNRYCTGWNYHLEALALESFVQNNVYQCYLGFFGYEPDNEAENENKDCSWVKYRGHISLTEQLNFDTLISEEGVYRKWNCRNWDMPSPDSKRDENDAYDYYDDPQDYENDEDYIEEF